MLKKISDSIQITLRWTLPFLIIFSVFYAISETHKETKLFIVDYTTDDIEVLSQLRNKGAMNNLSYIAGLIAVNFGFDIDAGGFKIAKGIGPFSFLAAVLNPEFKYVAVSAGLRQEQVADILSQKLNWDENDKREFTNNLPLCPLSGGEGYLFPGTYLIHKKEDPIDVRERMEKELFETITEITDSNSDNEVLNLRQILTIASLIQREAAGKQDMKLISGIIWNRLFSEMPLQIDATLQYAKANEDIGWWPYLKSDDKYINSPYNTYQNTGLPPGPIANPGKEAIEAALNPVDTSCLFYLHDKTRNIHCTSTYEKHKQNVNYYLK